MIERGDVARGKRRWERHGRWAERLAAALLAAKGYRILARRARTPWGELDLVARKRGLVCFVEVKFRGRPGPVEISRRQKRRIRAAAEAWLATRPRLEPSAVRFDAVFVWPIGFRHEKDAWREE